MQLVDEYGLGLSCERMEGKHIRAYSSNLAQKILKLLCDHDEGLSAAAIAKLLREHEQKVYYHVRKLIAAGALQIDHTEDLHGGTAKIIRLRAESFALMVAKPHEVLSHIPKRQSKMLMPFITAGKLNCKIVVGSPDPHGPESARSRDAAYAIDLGLFLGSQLDVSAPPSMILDTELRSWNSNLIIIGGPVVNKAAERINLRSPARYDVPRKEFIVYEKRYTQENAGVICKMPNPYAKGKWILHIFGKRYSGTRAAILALVNDFELMKTLECEPNGSFVRVVLGIDKDSDGIVDSVQFIR